MKAVIIPGEVFRVAAPGMLFEGRWAPSSNISPNTNMDVHPDGETFVMVTDPRTETSGSAPSGMPVRLVVNWFEELMRLAGN